MADNPGSWLGRFWKQPCKPYRNFQIVYLLLAANFIIPATSYSFAPAAALAQAMQVNTTLGGAPYPLDSELHSHLWRYLAAANVMTLGFMCVLLLVSLRRFYPVLVPLVFMKAYAALSWWVGFFAWTEQRWFLGAALLDTFTVTAFWYFATRAQRASRELDPATLVPRPR